MTRRNVYLSVSAILIAFISFAIGESLGQRTMLKQASIQLDGVQAMLLFDRIGKERKIKSLLERGCLTAATSTLDHDENVDMNLLAEFVRGRLDQPSITYIANRDSNILNELKTFKSKYGNTWSEPTCNN
jgi:hypothetical protein